MPVSVDVGFATVDMYIHVCLVEVYAVSGNVNYFVEPKKASISDENEGH